MSLFQSQKEGRFPLIVDEYEPDTYNSLEHRVKQRFTEGGNKLVNIKLSDYSQVLSETYCYIILIIVTFLVWSLFWQDVCIALQLSAYSSIFGDIPNPKVSKLTLQHLKYSIEEDYQFLTELEALKAITARVSSNLFICTVFFILAVAQLFLYGYSLSDVKYIEANWITDLEF